MSETISIKVDLDISESESKLRDLKTSFKNMQQEMQNADMGNVTEAMTQNLQAAVASIDMLEKRIKEAKNEKGERKTD